MFKKYAKQFCRPAEGNAEANRLYIMGPYEKGDKRKSVNPDAVEIGERPEQGKRNDLQAFYDDIKKGKRGRELNDDHLAVRAKYPRLEQLLVQEEDEELANQQEREGFKPEVHVRWGEPDAGKSRFVHDNYDVEDIYTLSMGDGCAKSIWWDGYRRHKIIHIEDFDGTQMHWRYFLRLTDRYKFRMQVKGGYTWRLCEKIYITSNEPPEQWYPAERHQYALMRRFTTVTEVKAAHAPLGSASASAPASPALRSAGEDP